MISRFAPCVFAAFVCFAACSSSSSSSSSSGGGDGGAGGDACATPAVNTGDGSSACGSATCTPGQYCFDNTVSDCENGCTAINDCAQGQYCDLTNPTTDGKNQKIGTCRAPPSCTSTGGGDSGGGGSCPDVHGVYNVTLNTASSSAACSNGFGNTTCTVTESNCALAWSCSPSNGFQTSNIDSSGDSTVTIPVPGGSGNATCALVFSSGSFTYDCQFTGNGAAVDCKGTGTEN
jgi:hypothetical protein